ELKLWNVSLRAANVQRMIKAWLEASRVPAKLVTDQDDTAQLFIPGTSIRGFSLRRRRAWFRNSIELRLSVGASRDDWQAAYSFIRFARDRGFEVRDEDGSVLRSGALTENAASERGRGQFVQDIGFLQTLVTSSDEGVVELPNARFALPVKTADLPA